MQSDDGRQQLLEEYGLVRSLAQMLVPTTVDGRKLPAVAAECLQILAQSGTFLHVYFMQLTQ